MPSTKPDGPSVPWPEPGRGLTGDGVGGGHVTDRCRGPRPACAPWAPSKRMRLAVFLRLVQNPSSCFHVLPAYGQDLRGRDSPSGRRTVRRPRSAGSSPRPLQQGVVVGPAGASILALQSLGVGQVRHPDGPAGRPCPHRPGRCRARWCRSSGASPRPPRGPDPGCLMQGQNQAGALSARMQHILRRDGHALGSACSRSRASRCPGIERRRRCR